MFKVELPPDSPQWVVPQPLLSEEKVYSLFIRTKLPEADTQEDWKSHSEWFATRFFEFGKNSEWYWQKYLSNRFNPTTEPT